MRNVTFKLKQEKIGYRLLEEPEALTAAKLLIRKIKDCTDVRELTLSVSSVVGCWDVGMLPVLLGFYFSLLLETLTQRNTS